MSDSRMRRSGALAMLMAAMLVAVTAASGCALFRRAPAVDPVVVPPDPPGIVGAITTVSRVEQGDVWGSILVEGGEQPPGAVSDKASVTVTQKTGIARDDRWIPPDDLEAGMTVRVWFDGPVAESYPVQGAASFIEVQ